MEPVAEVAGKRRSPVRRILAVVVLSLIAVNVLAFGVLSAMEGVAATGERFRTLAPGWVALALLVWSTSMLFQALRWRALLPTVSRPPTLGLAWVLFGGNALTLAMPGPVGEFGAAWYLRQRYGVPMATALAATLLGRFVALLVFGVATLVLWPFVDAGPAEQYLGPLAIVTGLSTLPLVVVCWRPALMTELVGKVAGLVLRGERLSRVQGRVVWWTKCFAAVGTIGWKRWVEAAFWSTCNLFILTLSTLLTLHAAGVEAAPVATLFVQALTAVASVAGMLIPGGFGAVELLLVAFFPVLAEGTVADAVFCATVLRAVHILTLTAGIPAMLWLMATLPEEPGKLRPLLQDAVEKELA